MLARGPHGLAPDRRRAGGRHADRSDRRLALDAIGARGLDPPNGDHCAAHRRSLPRRRRVRDLPDGTMVAFITGSPIAPTATQLWVRRLDAQAAKPIATDARSPFWSPDSKRIGFFGSGKLNTVSAGGASTPSATPSMAAAALVAARIIVFAPSSGGALMRVPTGGATRRPRWRSTRRVRRQRTAFRSSCRTARTISSPRCQATTASSTLSSSACAHSPDRTKIVDPENMPVHVDPGYLAFSRKSQVVVQPFDAKALKLTGDPTTLDDTPGNVGTWFLWRDPSRRAAGMLVYLNDPFGDRSSPGSTAPVVTPASSRRRPGDSPRSILAGRTAGRGRQADVSEGLDDLDYRSGPSRRDEDRRRPAFQLLRGGRPARDWLRERRRRRGESVCARRDGGDADRALLSVCGTIQEAGMVVGWQVPAVQRAQSRQQGTSWRCRRRRWRADAIRQRSAERAVWPLLARRPLDCYTSEESGTPRSTCARFRRRTRSIASRRTAAPPCVGSGTARRSS